MTTSVQIELSPARVVAAFSRYAEPLLREVTLRLTKPRNTIPEDELIEKCLAVLLNPPVLDRRIRDLPEAARRALALVGLMRRPTIQVGRLVVLLSALGHNEGLAPILTLLEQGLAVPATLPETTISQFESIFGETNIATAELFVLPSVAERAMNEDLGLPIMPSEVAPNAAARSTDGLDWLLRLAVLRQRIEESPMRLTMAQMLFKRDLARLQGDELLTAPATDELHSLPDVGVLSLFWAASCGLLNNQAGELTTAPFPASWGHTIVTALTELWAGLHVVDAWDPVSGYTPIENPAAVSPTATAGFLSLLLLVQCPPTQWAAPDMVAEWLWTHHPSWQGCLPKDALKNRGRNWVEAWWLGVAYPLQLLEVATIDGTKKVRLSAFGRRLLAGGPEPTPPASFPQCLLVQPNAEILAYRQGFTPELIAKLTRFAQWKTIGPACTLELTAERTYLGLEGGLSAATIQQTLSRHGTKPIPPSVADLLRRWADKRERLTVFPSAVLVEFQTAADLETAIARGIVSLRVTDRIGLTDDGREPEFKHLRLIGNRDYETKPQQCLTIAADGITMTLETAQSDLFLEADIGKLSDAIPTDPPGLRRYLLTPESLKRAQANGWDLVQLDAWFQLRAGKPLPAPARMFVTIPKNEMPASSMYRVLELPDAETADGLMQWPGTSALLERRLGPTAIILSDDNVPALLEVLTKLRDG